MPTLCHHQQQSIEELVNLRFSSHLQIPIQKREAQENGGYVDPVQEALGVGDAWDTGQACS